MALQVTTIMLAVEGMERSKKFYVALDAGGAIVKPAASAGWGGYFAYLADPDGHLWKIAASA